MKVAVTSFTYYAIIWWDQFKISRRRSGELPIDEWEDLKAAMRRRFVPIHHYKNLHLKLQRLKKEERSISRTKELDHKASQCPKFFKNGESKAKIGEDSMASSVEVVLDTNHTSSPSKDFLKSPYVQLMEEKDEQHGNAFYTGCHMKESDCDLKVNDSNEIVLSVESLKENEIKSEISDEGEFKSETSKDIELKCEEDPKEKEIVSSKERDEEEIVEKSENEKGSYFTNPNLDTPLPSSVVFSITDSRTHLFKEGENDVNQVSSTIGHGHVKESLGQEEQHRHAKGKQGQEDQQQDKDIYQGPMKGSKALSFQELVQKPFVTSEAHLGRRLDPKKSVFHFSGPNQHAFHSKGPKQC